MMPVEHPLEPPRSFGGSTGGSGRHTARVRSRGSVTTPYIRPRYRIVGSATARPTASVMMQAVGTGLREAVDVTAARIVGETLRTAGYTETAITEMLGEDAFAARKKDLPVLLRRVPETRLGTVIRAFFLVQPVPTADLTKALGERGVGSLEAAGVADVGDDETAVQMRILPVAGLLVASDDDPTHEDDELRTDFVAAYTAASRLTDSLTPRPEVERALDVGTGSGVHALLTAAHAKEVIATDVNARALAYTELNAALNGIRNIECREGSLFEPVQGEKFDLIICNAPYVVSPETRWAYRDGGFAADDVSQRVVTTAAEHLRDGGYAALLVSWLGFEEGKQDVRPLEWTASTGCDTWILPIWGGDPLTHAATWNDHLTDEPEAYEKAIAEWTSYLGDLGVHWVSEGGILLHKRDAEEHTTRIDQVDEDDLEDSGDQILRAFESRAVLADMKLGRRAARREHRRRRPGAPRVVARAGRHRHDRDGRAREPRRGNASGSRGERRHDRGDRGARRREALRRGDRVGRLEPRLHARGDAEASPRSARGRARAARARRTLLRVAMLLFIGVSALVIATPGQDTALTIRNTLLGSRATGIATALGVGAGQAAWTAATALGVGALLAASEPAFAALRLAGAAYLVWLGLRTLRTAVRGADTDRAQRPRGTTSSRRVPAGSAQQPGQPEDARVLHEPAAAVQLDERRAARARSPVLRAHDDLAERVRRSSSPVRAACSTRPRSPRARRGDEARCSSRSGSGSRQSARDRARTHRQVALGRPAVQDAQPFNRRRVGGRVKLNGVRVKPARRYASTTRSKRASARCSGRSS